LALIPKIQNLGLQNGISTEHLHLRNGADEQFETQMSVALCTGRLAGAAVPIQSSGHGCILSGESILLHYTRVPCCLLFLLKLIFHYTIVLCLDLLTLITQG